MKTHSGTDRLLRPYEIYTDSKKGRIGRLPISRATYYLWVAEGRLPKPRKLSERVAVTAESELNQAIDRLTIEDRRTDDKG